MKLLKYLTRYCHFCQKYGKLPSWFKFTLRNNVNFNYCIIVDIMYINRSLVLYIVNKYIRFQAGRQLQNISAKYIQDIVRICWINTYLGPLDVITYNIGKNFISKEFKEYATIMGIITKGVPVKAYNLIGIVKHYHSPLQRVYQIIIVKILNINKDAALQMAFKTINNSIGPNRLVPTLLVFGAYPRITNLDAPLPIVM